MLSLTQLGFPLFLIGIAGQIRLTFAANDWNTPCFDGVCQYSLTAAPGQNGSGTMQIWGSPDALSDITPAAGWQILNCSSTEMAQDIRLVCMNNNTEAAGCDHLFQAGGAVGKIVRLPENCGMSPFARVANASVSEDQSIPASLNTTAQVQALSLDTNFGAIDPSKAGNLNIAIQGANFPGADVNGTLVPTTTTPQRRSLSEGRNLMPEKRGLFSSLNDISENKTDDLPPINVDKSATIFSKSLSCGDVDLSVDLSVDGQANAQASIGVVAQGTIVPPELTDFQVIVGLNADIGGTVNLNAGVEATFSTGQTQIFTVGIPGLDIPGVFSLGPTFNVNVEADAVLDLAADLEVGLVYNISNAQLVFPPGGDAQSGGEFNIGDTPLTLSLTPSVTATGNFTAHLIPSLNLGISALDGAASASIFLNLDASATLVLGLEATDDESVTVDNGSSGSSTTTASSSSTSTSTSSSSDSNSSSSSSPSSPSSSSSVASRDYFEYKRSSEKVAKPKVAKPTSVVQAVGSAKQAAASTSVSSPAHSSSTSTSASSASTSVTSSSGSNSTASNTNDNNNDSGTSSNNSTISSTTNNNSTSSGSNSTISSTNNNNSSSSSNSTISSTSNNNSSSGSNSTSSNTNSSSSSTSLSSSSSSSGLQFGGCIAIDAGLSVNAGAEGKFFSIFDDSTEVPLFSKEFVLFQKCFGGADISQFSSSTPAAPPADSNSDASSSSNALTCLGGTTGSPESVVNATTIAADTIEAVD